jgi:GntR family transcriptional regulator
MPLVSDYGSKGLSPLGLIVASRTIVCPLCQTSQLQLASRYAAVPTGHTLTFVALRASRLVRIFNEAPNSIEFAVSARIEYTDSVNSGGGRVQTNPLQKTSESPLYRQLMQRLRNDITAGVYPAGERIPGEQALCGIYGVSRVTVRKALDEIVREELLVRRQGKGTFVAQEKIKRDLSRVTSFSDACAQIGQTAQTRLIERKREAATGEDRARLGVEEGGGVISICRLRLSDGEPVMLEYNRFSAALKFLLDDPLTGSLYRLLSNHGLAPSSAVHDISLGHAKEPVSRLLDTKTGDALLLLDQLVFDQHGNPLHLSKQWIRGDRFTFRI